MPTIQELVDERATTFAQAEEFATRHAAGTDMSPEDHQAWERALSEVDRLGTVIATRQRTEALRTRFDEIDEQSRAEAAGAGTPAGGDAGGGGDDSQAYRAAFGSWCRNGMARLSAAEQELLHRGAVELSPDQARALGATTGGSAGGYTVPEGFWAKVTETMKYFGGAADGAEEITTSTGNKLPWATNDDTANEGYYVGENVELTNEGDIVLGQAQLEAHTLASGPARISLILIQDAAIDPEALVAKKIGERLARRSNRAFTTGDGANKPAGYVPGLTTGKTAAATNAVTYNEIIDLEHSVDASYRATGRCRYKFHDLTLGALRKVRDDSGGAGVGRPLWQPAITAGAPDTFNGYPYSVNNDQPTMAAGAKAISFGDFQSAFVIRRVSGGQMLRLAERYAEFLQVGFLAFERHDSVVQDPSAAKNLVMAP